MHIDMTGQRFGKWTALSFAFSKQRKHSKQTYWLCRCDCGTEKPVQRFDLINGRTTRCVKCRTPRNVKHHHTFGGVRSKTYDTWRGMIQRCTNPRDTSFAYYGGRGIGVCKRWLKFENFLADMNERPVGKTLDRKNNNKGYSKANCRWATKVEQMKNTRRNIR